MPLDKETKSNLFKGFKLELKHKQFHPYYKFKLSILFPTVESLPGAVVNLLDSDIEVSEFELQSRYSVHFWTNASWERYELSYSPIYGLNSPSAVSIRIDLTLNNTWRLICH